MGAPQALLVAVDEEAVIVADEGGPVLVSVVVPVADPVVEGILDHGLGPRADHPVEVVAAEGTVPGVHVQRALSCDRGPSL